jgi:methylated-DNA-protein-cysteine methyltransferase related protein
MSALSMQPTDSTASRAALILRRVRAIPEGFVRTYGDIYPSAPRLVGHVLATASEDVPWHRVVRADGSPPMGRPQLERLGREGVPTRGDRVDMRLARLPAALSQPLTDHRSIT